MTTKLKISLGFLLMLLIIFLLSLVAYDSTLKNEDALKQNSFYSSVNVDMSDTIAAMYQAAFHKFFYQSSFDKAHSVAITESLNTIKSLVKKNLLLMENQEHKELLNNITSGLDNYEASVKTFYSDLDKFSELYEKKFLPEKNKVAKALEQIIQNAWEEKNTPALYYLLLSSNAFQDVSMYINAFFSTFKNEDFDKAIKEVSKIENNLLKLKDEIISTKMQSSYSKLVDSVSTLKSQVEIIKNSNFRVDKADQLLISYRKVILDNANKINSIYDSLMKSFNKQSLNDNSDLRSQVMLISGIGFLLGIICTIFITSSLGRVLSKLSSYATAISHGNFKHNPEVSEKGDIGKMVDAIHQIPTIFESIINRSNDIAYSISSGTFREELPEEEFYGDFSTLAISVNSISKSFVKVIDALPTGIITANKDHAVLFMNDAARKTFGNLESTKSLNDIDRDLTQAIRTSSIVKDETSVANNGTTFNLSISALPLTDTKANVVGGMEIVTDITEMKEKQKTMLYVAEQASEIADKVAAASEELATQMEQISNGATIQKTRIESTASAMTEMNSTVIEVAQSAALASEQSEQTRVSAESGADLVNNVVSSIDAVNTISSHLQSNMHELGNQADNIGGVMNVISDIADQTNLLALNAAIEAARAGEAGRGFAVVADEVRKLAEKTMTATSEVGSNISAIQQSARTNIEAMNKAASNIQEATELANSSGKALEHILEIASKTSSFVTSIATAAEEQSATSEEITHSVEEVNRVTSETTKGISQSSLAVQELSNMAQELKSVMEHLK